MEAGEEVVQCIFYAVLVVQFALLACAVRQAEQYLAVADGNAGQGAQADERTVVLVPVVVRTLHQGALREDVAHLQVGAHRGVEVAQEGAVVGVVSIGFHKGGVC